MAHTLCDDGLKTDVSHLLTEEVTELKCVHHEDSAMDLVDNSGVTCLNSVLCSSPSFLLSFLSEPYLFIYYLGADFIYFHNTNFH